MSSACARMRSRRPSNAEFSRLPSVGDAIPLAKALDGLNGRILIFCDEDADTRDPVAALSHIARGAPLAVLIGPEGGFADEERAVLLQASGCGAACAGSAHPACRHRGGRGADAGSDGGRRLGLSESRPQHKGERQRQQHHAGNNHDAAAQTDPVADEAVEDRRNRTGADGPGIELTEGARAPLRFDRGPAPSRKEPTTFRSARSREQAARSASLPAAAAGSLRSAPAS